MKQSKQRLLTFGCSHTFGHGLKDCINPKNNHPLDTPSKFAWPKLLGDLLNIETVNLSYPGSSAKQVLHTVLNTEIRQSDIVIVLWPHHHRVCFYKDENEYFRIGPWMDEAKYYYDNCYFDYDSTFEYFQKINMCEYFVKSKTDTCYQFIFEDINKRFNWNQVDIKSIYFSDIRKSNPLALDNLHPGLDAHNEFANKLYLEIIK
jgi:hypothetical protein